jgi:hypothetical protein
MRSFIICTYPQISLGKENKVSWACGTHGRRKFTWFWWESPKNIDHSEERGADGRMGSEWILREIFWGYCNRSARANGRPVAVGVV